MKFLTVVFIVNTFLMAAQTTPQKVALPELGLSFDIPSGWSGDQYDDYILLGHQKIPGMIVLFQNHTTSADELRKIAQEGIIDEGVNLQPNGEFILQSDQRVQGEYKGQFQGNPVRAFSIGLINGIGTGMNIIILTSHDKFTAQHIEEANKIAASVKFTAVQDSEATTEWKQWLVGKKLKYLYSNYSSDYMGGSTSMSDTTIINLYEDGTFHYYSSSLNTFTSGSTTPLTDNDSSGFGAVGDQDQNNGKYTIYSDTKGSYLELHFTNDKVFEYELARDSEKFTTLNGTRYYVVSLDRSD